MLRNFARKLLASQGYTKLKPYAGVFPVLNSRQYVLDKSVDREEILTLIKKLRPVHSGKDLIRLGPEGDGGYLLPDDLEGIAACFSPGVGLLSGFEEDCYRRGMELFMIDATVEKPQTKIPHTFGRKFLGAVPDEQTITLKDWVAGTKWSALPDDLLLQMDVEGSEYPVLLSTDTELLGRFRIIIIEFHSLHTWWGSSTFNLVRPALENLLRTHACVHLHPNNVGGIDDRQRVEIPRHMEFTFLRRDRITDWSIRKEFPHSLDYSNTTYPELPLPPIWYD